MKCQKCQKEVFLPFRCPYCGGYFCPEHRLPEAHECPNMELAWAPKEAAPMPIIQKQKSYEYTVTYLPVQTAKRKVYFSAKEVKHLTIAALLVSGIGLSSAIYLMEPGSLALFILIILASFFIHEIAHKIIAQREGFWAEFRLTFTGALLTILSMLSPFFKIISPGAVMISGFADNEKIGKIAIAGPTTNIILSTVLFLIAFLLPQNNLIFAIGAAFNAWIALFNLIPFGILDGFKIFLWNKKVWASAFTISLVLTLISYKLIF
ncbi:MAG: AN1-type zinc finger domain-containing protein [Candidatus Bathyarchaeota archaeon]|nr:AN1-type zinc finger domain-containing protein [Candidatus Bathyarchaeota archaeon]